MFNGTPTAARRVVLVQAGFAPALAVAGAALAGIETGLALLYGSLVACVATAVLMWREQQAMCHPEWDQHRLFKLFIRVGLERLTLLAGLLAIGFGVLRLAPLPLLLGLLLAQLAWWVVATRRSTRSDRPPRRQA